jgi:hypothetical protein
MSLHLDPNITNEDLLVLADLLDAVKQDHYYGNNPSPIIDVRSRGEMARVLDSSLEADLRASYVLNDPEAQEEAAHEAIDYAARTAAKRNYS